MEPRNGKFCVINCPPSSVSPCACLALSSACHRFRWDGRSGAKPPCQHTGNCRTLRQTAPRCFPSPLSPLPLRTILPKQPRSCRLNLRHVQALLERSEGAETTIAAALMHFRAPCEAPGAPESKRTPHLPHTKKKGRLGSRSLVQKNRENREGILEEGVGNEKGMIRPTGTRS